MDVELQATCSALGFLEGKEYIKEPDCLETVKDLIRFLRRDTDTCDIRRQLGHAKILQNDLIPLVVFYHEDKTLFDTVIKLIVNLTQPVITCFNNEIPDEKTLRNNCLEVEAYLQDYKEAFVNEDLFNILSGKIQDILKLNWEDRREEDKLQLERLFVLIRNVLMIPPDYDREKRTEDDASVHDQILWTFHTTGVEDLILYVASNDRERSSLCMHVLEIIFLMFREQEAETLASAGVQRSNTEKEKDQKELEQAREKEKAQKKASILKFSARHSRFGGTYVIKNMKSISESEVIYHKPLCEMERFSLDSTKTQKKRAKNRVAIKTDVTKRRSTLSMRLSLKEFCVQFLVNAYNPLMRTVKDALTRKTAQDNDETYYMWTMRFFMQFCRLHCKRVDLISETMSLPAFHYIYTQLCTYYENIRLGKGEECKVWGRRAHLALKAYQELLHTLDSMYRSEDEKLRESARVIQSNVFYMVEYRDVFITLLRNFQESKCSRAYLRDLVESTHIFLKMLERFMKSSRHLIVQKKGARRRKAKKNAAKESGPAQEDLAAAWSEQVSGELSAVLENCPEPDSAIVPFDAASDMDIDEQRIMAMLKIQACLRERKLVEAVSLFHAAREVWPERDEFGSENMGIEEELNALQEIFMAHLQNPQSGSQHAGEHEEDEEIANDIEEEEIEETQTCETEFNFKVFIADFAHQEVIKKYAILLEEFTTNSDAINHCVVKMLHRLAFDLGFVGMLFQASIFRTLNTLLQGPCCRLQRYQEMVKFACYVVRQFTKVAEVNKKVFVDLLFWKSKTEATAITGGYDFQQKSKGKVLWTEHEEQELLCLYEKYRDVVHPELDLVELIQGELTSSHTRLQILKELKRQGLINSAKDIKRKGVRPPKWTDEEIQNVKEAFNVHCKSDYPIFDIMKALNTSKSKRAVIAKLIELGLVQEKSQLLRQKRSKRRSGKGTGNRDEDDLFPDIDRRGRRKKESDDDDDDSDGHDDEGVEDGDEDDDSEAESDGDNISEGDHESMGRDIMPATVSDCLNNLMEKGYSRQVSWIMRGLRNAAEDRDDGVCVPTPLVPLTEETETAMEDAMFLAFLHSIRLSPPVSEQEMFWRIPAEYSASDLSKIADCLQSSVSGQSGADDIQKIVSQVFPSSSLSSSSSATSKNHTRKTRKHESARDTAKTKKKHKSKRKVLKDTQLSVKNNTINLSHSDAENMDIATNSCSEEEMDTDNVLVPNISVLAKTNVTDLSSEDETSKPANDLEKGGNRSNKKLNAENRRQALQQMIQKRNAKRDVSRSRKQGSVSDRGRRDSHSSVDNDEPSPHTELDDSVLLNGNHVRSTESGSLSSSRQTTLEPDTTINSKSSKPGQEVPAGVKKRFLESDSESDDNHLEATTGGEDNSRTNTAQLTKRLRFLSSDDDDDDVNGSSQGKDVIQGDNVGNQQTDSFPATLFSEALSSSDEDDHITLRTAVRKRKLVIDESDDD